MNNQVLYTIVGAGIAGLTLAIAFEQAGIQYQIVERSPKLKSVGAGIWLAPNALQVLDSLGLLREIQDKGNSIDRIALTDAKMKAFSDTQQSSIRDKFGFSTIAIHRGLLQETLLSKIPTSKIFLGHEFDSLEIIDSEPHLQSREDQNCLVKCTSGAVFQSQYVIGADGIHSGVRKALFGDIPQRYSGQTCWRGVCDIRLGSEFQHRGMESWGNQVRFGMSYISEEKVYWFAVASATQAESDHGSDPRSKLLEMYRDFYPEVSHIIQATQLENIMRNDICDLKPQEKWSLGNVLLIGDAAHAMTPNLGQGGAQSIEDVHTLIHLVRKGSCQNLFDEFQALRKPKVDGIIKESWNVGQLAHIKYGKRLRNFMMKSIPKSLMEKKLINLYSLEV